VERYLLAEKKLRLDLKSICQDNHMWKLKTLDMNDIEVVKVHYAECGKDFGSSTGNHSKSTVYNFFMNFKKSHLMPAIHIRKLVLEKGDTIRDSPPVTSWQGQDYGVDSCRS
jgi:hypothetical protein